MIDLINIVQFIEKFRRRKTEREIIGLVYPYDAIQRVIHRYNFAYKHGKGKVLEIGCGEGYGLSYLSRNAEIIVGGDYSFETLIKSKEKNYCKNNIEYVCLDAQRLPFQDNTFDTVLALELIEHLINPKAFLKEVRRVLKSSGVLILSTPNGEVKRPIEPYHTKLFIVEELMDILKKSGFNNIGIYAFPRDKEEIYIIALTRYIVDSLLDILLTDIKKYNLFRKLAYKLCGVSYVVFDGINEKLLDSTFAPRSLEEIKSAGLKPWDLIIIAK